MKKNLAVKAIVSCLALVSLAGLTSCDKGHTKTKREDRARLNTRKSAPHEKQHAPEAHKKYDFKSETHPKQHPPEAHKETDFKSEPHDKEHAEPSSK